MKFSIITACYNSEKTIGATLASVKAQSYKNIEYIVIDGASTDRTLAVVKQSGVQVDALISEPDRGIYDALNKGLAIATGDVVGFLHSDDVYASPQVLQLVAYCFEATNSNALYGDLQYVQAAEPGTVVRHWESGSYSKAELRKGWMPPHPTFFAKRKLYLQYGNFDTSFRIAADYDLMLRLLWANSVHAAYIPQVLVQMRLGGASNASLRQIIRKSKEDLRAMRNNGMGGIGTLLMKNLRKVPQFFSKG